MTLDLNDEEREALIRYLPDGIERDCFPSLPRLDTAVPGKAGAAVNPASAAGRAQTHPDAVRLAQDVRAID